MKKEGNVLRKKKNIAEVLEGQMDIATFLENNKDEFSRYYESAVEYVHAHGIVHVGTLMRVLKISANSSIKIMDELKKNKVVNADGRLFSEKKNEWSAKN